MKDLGFRVQGSGLSVKDPGFTAQRKGFRILSHRFRLKVSDFCSREHALQFRGHDLGLGVPGTIFLNVPCLFAPSVPPHVFIIDLRAYIYTRPSALDYS